MPQTLTKASAQSTWPDDLSFKAFKNFSPASEDWVYKKVYTLRSHQITIRNQRIALCKLSKILRATFKLSASMGFHSMSLRNLSQESGISMGGLYAYIGSKEELANLIAHVLRTINNELTELALASITDVRDKLDALICCHIYLSEQLHPWFYFVFMESKSLAKAQKSKVKQMETDYEHRVSSLLEQGIKEGVFEPVDIDLTASAIVAMLQDWHLKTWKYRSRKITPDQYAQFMLNMLRVQLGI